MAVDPLAAQKEAAAEALAAEALAADAGCLPGRAKTLVDAYANVAAQEAVSVIAGSIEVSSGVLDVRVARLSRLIDALPDEERFPDAYELGAIFKITVSQARSLIRTYQARYPNAYRTRLDAAVKKARPDAQQIGNRVVWVIEFDDPDSLDYAYDRLRRRGLTKDLERDVAAQTLTVRRDLTDRQGDNALQILGLR